MASERNVQQPVSSAKDPLDTLSINTIRTLSMDAVQPANSGHPGTPMALAPVAYVLWQDICGSIPMTRSGPTATASCSPAGHASMLLYSLLHLAGVKAVNKDYEILGTPSVSLDDIKKFRQLHSQCPGHPEYRLTSGVETTTGPLGQGVANRVGMAIAERWLAAHYNQPGFEDLIDFNVYAICSDGDMMEGISHEAASIAGHLKLSNLCWIYDNNHITIEGKTDAGLQRRRGRAVHGLRLERDRGSATPTTWSCWNGPSRRFSRPTDRPTLIIVDSHIACGLAHKQDTHGGPRRAAGRGRDPADQEVLRLARGRQVPRSRRRLRAFPGQGIGTPRQGSCATPGSPGSSTTRRSIPQLADELYRMQHRQLPEGWDKDLPTYPADPKGMATRASSGKVLNAIAKNVPWLIGGAADLAPSTKTS